MTDWLLPQLRITFKIIIEIYCRLISAPIAGSTCAMDAGRLLSPEADRVPP